ncbi:hypothetical protein D7V93_09100 [Corallococcus llansteffanensis]|uniref:Lipoprotein n=2 Tax=Corallococcus llansteffanensis TaxID=2316731 RepID=A0A3A8QJ36_9BACT|nr:hypothetical protein D7V93_09100 [Corallococcus llansteffanensis]
MRRVFEGLSSAAVVLTAIMVIAGCGATPEDEAEFDVKVAESSLSFTGWVVYDAGTRCTVGGSTMHCCPTGYAMIGAHLSNDVFKCAQLSSTSGSRFLDAGGRRNGMHACPYGSVMVGLHVSNDYLACQYPGTSVVSEYVDGDPGTKDSYPMHVCGAGGYAMSGIHVSNNLFNCAR